MSIHAAANEQVVEDVRGLIGRLHADLTALKADLAVTRNEAVTMSGSCRDEAEGMAKFCINALAFLDDKCTARINVM